jgi:hypothetical protein
MAIIAGRRKLENVSGTRQFRLEAKSAVAIAVHSVARSSVADGRARGRGDRLSCRRAMGSTTSNEGRRSKGFSAFCRPPGVRDADELALPIGGGLDVVRIAQK